MAHERETWLDHGAAELLLRGRPVETADVHAQAQADRLARVLEEAASVAYAGGSPGEGAGADAPVSTPVGVATAELPGEAAALAAFRQAVGTAGQTVSPGGDAEVQAEADRFETVRLAPERRGVRLPNFGRPLRLGLAAAMAGCALSGVAAGAGYLYAPSAGESPSRPGNSVSDAATPEPLVSEVPSVLGPPTDPADTPGSGGADSVAPGATGADGRTSASGGPTDERNGEKSPASGHGWKSGDGEKWYAKLVQACQEYRNGTISAGKKKLLEDAAKGPLGVTRLCDQLLNDDAGDSGHYEGAPSHGHGGNGNGGGGSGGSGNGIGGVDGPQTGLPGEGGTGGGTDGGSGGGTDGGSVAPPSGWPGGDFGETIGMNPPEADGTSLPPLLPAMPGSDAGTGSDPGTDPGTGSDSGTGTGTGSDSGTGADSGSGSDGGSDTDAGLPGS